MNKEQLYGLHKAGKRAPLIKSKTHGNLLLDGKEIEYNKPFAVLQYLKSQRVRAGTSKKRLKIVAMYIKI